MDILRILRLDLQTSRSQIQTNGDTHHRGCIRQDQPPRVGPEAYYTPAPPEPQPSTSRPDGLRDYPLRVFVDGRLTVYNRPEEVPPELAAQLGLAELEPAAQPTPNPVSAVPLTCVISDMVEPISSPIPDDDEDEEDVQVDPTTPPMRTESPTELLADGRIPLYQLQDNLKEVENAIQELEAMLRELDLRSPHYREMARRIILDQDEFRRLAHELSEEIATRQAQHEIFPLHDQTGQALLAASRRLRDQLVQHRTDIRLRTEGSAAPTRPPPTPIAPPPPLNPTVVVTTTTGEPSAPPVAQSTSTDEAMLTATGLEPREPASSPYDLRAYPDIPPLERELHAAELLEEAIRKAISDLKGTDVATIRRKVALDLEFQRVLEYITRIRRAMLRFMDKPLNTANDAPALRDFRNRQYQLGLIDEALRRVLPKPRPGQPTRVGQTGLLTPTQSSTRQPAEELRTRVTRIMRISAERFAAGPALSRPASPSGTETDSDIEWFDMPDPTPVPGLTAPPDHLVAPERQVHPRPTSLAPPPEIEERLALIGRAVIRPFRPAYTDDFPVLNQPDNANRPAPRTTQPAPQTNQPPQRTIRQQWEEDQAAADQRLRDADTGPVIMTAPQIVRQRHLIRDAEDVYRRLYDRIRELNPRDPETVRLTQRQQSLSQRVDLLRELTPNNTMPTGDSLVVVDHTTRWIREFIEDYWKVQRPGPSTTARPSDFDPVNEWRPSSVPAPAPLALTYEPVAPPSVGQPIPTELAQALTVPGPTSSQPVDAAIPATADSSKEATPQDVEMDVSLPDNTLELSSEKPTEPESTPVQLAGAPTSPMAVDAPTASSQPTLKPIEGDTSSGTLIVRSTDRKSTGGRPEPATPATTSGPQSPRFKKKKRTPPEAEEPPSQRSLPPWRGPRENLELTRPTRPTLPAWSGPPADLDVPGPTRPGPSILKPKKAEPPTLTLRGLTTKKKKSPPKNFPGQEHVLSPPEAPKIPSGTTQPLRDEPPTRHRIRLAQTESWDDPHNRAVSEIIEVDLRLNLTEEDMRQRLRAGDPALTDHEIDRINRGCQLLVQERTILIRKLMAMRSKSQALRQRKLPSEIIEHAIYIRGPHIDPRAWTVEPRPKPGQPVEDQLPPEEAESEDERPQMPAAFWGVMSSEESENESDLDENVQRALYETSQVHHLSQ
ncbi:titin-like [Paramacrobiotus metropolitanus]|uniref:titin-like n=1 Tax=Paramacrobiotus metropolitanus TaxID=2943436 RepID=UPI00244561FA|nr:titin-like [Paramacrobiotus metropolitanus]